MKKIILALSMLVGLSSVVSAAQTKYRCVVTQNINVKTKVGRKLTTEQMKQAMFEFKYDKDNRVIVDAANDVWSYKFTKGSVDYYTDGNKNLFFLIGKSYGKYLNSGIYDIKENRISKSICKEQ